MRRLFNILFFFIGGILYATNPIIDSLKSILATSKEPIIRLHLNREIGSEYLKGQIYLDSTVYYLQRAQDISTKHNFEKEQPKTFFLLARAYGILENWEKSIIFFKKSIQVSQKFNLKRGIVSSYNNLGHILMKKNDFEGAKQYYTKALEFADNDINTKNFLLKAIALSNLAEIYFNEGDYNKSLELIHRSTIFYNKIGILSTELHTISAKTNFALNNIDIAEKEALLAHKIALKKNDLEYIYQTSFLLSNIFENKRDFQKAISYFKTASITKENIVTSREENEIEKMELEKMLKNQKNEVKVLKQNNQYLTIIYILVLVGIVLLVLLVFRQLKIIRMTKNLHEVQHSIIKKELDKQKESLYKKSK